MDELIRSSVCWPTPEQELLLQAALGNREQAIAAWERYYEEQGLDHLDEGSFRLLPQVYRHLHSFGYDAPIMGRLKGIHRMAWCKNQLLFHEIAGVARDLQEAGIPTMLLKGGALSLAVYRDRGARPMRDLDLLVPSADANRALQLLGSKGWSSTLGHDLYLTPKHQRYRHAIELVNRTDRRVDLHWHLLYHARSEAADASFWKEAWPLEFDGAQTRVLPPTLQLLHTLVHGLEGNAISPVRWVCDAVMTIRSTKISWEQLVDVACQHDVVSPVRDAMHYLHETFEVPVPRSILWRLEREPVGRFTKLEYRRHLLPQRLHSPWVTLISNYQVYFRGVQDWSLPRRLAGFPDYLAFFFRLPGSSHLPKRFANWVRHRVRCLLHPSGATPSETQG